jgi:hypothetical protein
MCHVPPGNNGKAKEICVDAEDVQELLNEGSYLGCCGGR